MTDAIIKSYKKFFDLNEIIKKIEAYLPGFDKERFLKAFYFAEEAHRGQMRKDKVTPYLVHPISAVEILAEMHADEDALVAAMVHDVPEDTNHTLEEVEKLFGKDVAFFVDGVTKLSKVHYQHNMPEREVASLKKLFLHSAKDLRIILIKLADRLHNMRTLEYVERSEKRLRISRETLEIYVPIANLLGIYFLKDQLEDLCFIHLFPIEHEKFKAKFDGSAEREKSNGQAFIRKLKRHLQETKIEAKVFLVKRNLYRVYKKLIAQSKTLDDIKDRITVRVIVKSIPECYQTLGIIHGQFTPKPDRFKDYIAHPKVNGYQSLHSVVFGIDGMSTEIQISTQRMDLEAKYGIAYHFFEDRRIDWSKDKRVLWINKILEMDNAKEISDDFLENLKLDIVEERIVLFTPKGLSVDLPRGATAIDFAYAIHSEIGNHAIKAKINGKILPLSTSLHNGDVISIITEDSAKPELFWLSFIKTGLAKNKILMYFKKIGRGQKIKEGHGLLQKEFDIAGIGLIGKINFKNIKENLNEKFLETFGTWEDLFVAIGEGRIKAISAARAIQKTKGTPGFLFDISNKWDYKALTNKNRFNIKIAGKNRPGLLADIMKIIYKHVVDVTNVNAYASANLDYAYFSIQVIVTDIESVSHICEELEHFEDVTSVYSISSKVLSTFYLLWGITITFWVFYPFTLEYIIKSELIKRYYYATSFVLIGGLFMMVFMLIYLNSLTKRYFPLIRHKMIQWGLSMTVATGIIVIMLSEMFYYNFQSLWYLPLAMGIIMYGYLLISYFSYRNGKS